MTSGSASNGPLEDHYARLYIAEEEERGVAIVGSILRVVDSEFKLCQMGRFLSNKQIKLNYMSNMIASAWRPVCGITFKDIGEGCYLFRFYHELDLQRTLDNGPWF